jgi:hypothetical protein
LYNFHFQLFYFNSGQKPSEQRKLKESPRVVSLPDPHAEQVSVKEESANTFQILSLPISEAGNPRNQDIVGASLFLGLL